MPFEVQTGCDTKNASEMVSVGGGEAKAAKGRCLGQSLDWLEFVAEKGHPPTAIDFWNLDPTKSSMKRVQTTQVKYALLKRMGKSDNEAITEIVHDGNHPNLEKAEFGAKHGRQAFSKKTNKFLKTGKDVIKGGVGGYLILSDTHAMAVHISTQGAVFFDPNFGQMQMVHLDQFPREYEKFATKYNKSKQFFASSSSVRVF